RRHKRSKRDWSSDVCSSDLVIAVPGIGVANVLINSPEGSSMEVIPESFMEKQPTSSVEPQRFLTERMNRSWEWRSPWNWQTTSTRCSMVRGPAMLPSLVTCPTRMVAMSYRLANLIMLAVTSWICMRPPGAPSMAADWMVCTESTTKKSG